MPDVFWQSKVPIGNGSTANEGSVNASNGPFVNYDVGIQDGSVPADMWVTPVDLGVGSIQTEPLKTNQHIEVDTVHIHAHLQLSWSVGTDPTIYFENPITAVNATISQGERTYLTEPLTLIGAKQIILGGFSGITQDLHYDTVFHPYTPIGFRDFEALQLSLSVALTAPFVRLDGQPAQRRSTLLQLLNGSSSLDFIGLLKIDDQ